MYKNMFALKCSTQLMAHAYNLNARKAQKKQSMNVKI